METLPEDLLPCLLAALGDSAMSYASGVQLSGVNAQFRALGARLPIKDGACTLNLNHVSNVMLYTKCLSWDVFDVETRCIVRVCCDTRLSKFSFEGKPTASARYLEADLRLVWMTTSGVRLSLANVHPVDDKARIGALIKLPLDAFKLTKEQKTAASSKELTTLKPRRVAHEVAHEPEADGCDSDRRCCMTLDRVASDALKEINSSLRALTLSRGDTPRPSSFDFRRFMTDKLTHISIHGFILCPRQVSQLACLDAADRLHMLDLTGSAILDADSCRDLGLLIQRWRADPSAAPIRKLILDDAEGFEAGHKTMSDKIMSDKSRMSLSDLVYGACMPGNESWEAVDSHSQITQGTPQVYISTFPVAGPRQWHVAIESAPMRPPLAYPTVRVVTTASSVVWMSPTKKQKAAAAPLATAAALSRSVHAVHVAALQPESEYSNAVRERDRYMIQWFDYKCSNCGAVWKADCVTVSYRQTAVSQCLKGHKKCTDRTEYARMGAGELYITNKHMAGNGGTDLTPMPALIAAAKAAGLIVAINPSDKKPLFFKPSPDRPPPAKVVVPESAVPPEVLAVV